MTTPSVIADLKLQLAQAEHDHALAHYRACLATYLKEAEKGVTIEEFRALEALSFARRTLSDHAILLEHHVTQARGRPVAVHKSGSGGITRQPPVNPPPEPPPPKVVTKPVTKTKTKA